MAFYLVYFFTLKHCSADTVNHNENQHVVTALSVESLPTKSLLWFWAVTLPKCLGGISEKHQVQHQSSPAMLSKLFKDFTEMPECLLVLFKI